MAIVTNLVAWNRNKYAEKTLPLVTQVLFSVDSVVPTFKAFSALTVGMNEHPTEHGEAAAYLPAPAFLASLPCSTCMCVPACNITRCSGDSFSLKDYYVFYLGKRQKELGCKSEQCECCCYYLIIAILNRHLEARQLGKEPVQQGQSEGKLLQTPVWKRQV